MFLIKDSSTSVHNFPSRHLHLAYKKVKEFSHQRRKPSTSKPET